MGPWHLGNLIGNPLESTVAVHHLIFGGVLDRYPGLKLVVAHGGGFLPAYSGRVDHGAAARPDTCEHLHHEPTHYLKRLYFDTMVFTHHQLEYLVEQWGADHILMGTDYPFDMGEVDPIGFSKARSAERGRPRRCSATMRSPPQHPDQGARMTMSRWRKLDHRRYRARKGPRAKAPPVDRRRARRRRSPGGDEARG